MPLDANNFINQYGNTNYLEQISLRLYQTFHTYPDEYMVISQITINKSKHSVQNESIFIAFISNSDKERYEHVLTGIQTPG